MKYVTIHGQLFAETEFGHVPVTQAMLESRKLRWGFGPRYETDPDTLYPKDVAEQFESELTNMAREDMQERLRKSER